MNKPLQQLLEVCDKLNMTIMKYDIYLENNETPSAVVEDDSGRISVIYYEDGVWC